MNKWLILKAILMIAALLLGGFVIFCVRGAL